MTLAKRIVWVLLLMAIAATLVDWSRQDWPGLTAHFALFLILYWFAHNLDWLLMDEERGAKDWLNSEQRWVGAMGLVMLVGSLGISLP
ncbi:hypothetical protein [Ferrimonas pelagia]|uniref:Uncharacterized protein n=1 Tax=Ferrimonas pelagia TaxID=1177826 RepID=A0ABP9F6Z4_9GAMM